MSFHPEHLAVMYDCLRQLPPFCRWKLPEADAIEFRAPCRKDDSGEFIPPNIIMVSTHFNGTFTSALMTLAHEMIHVAKLNAKNHHDALFKRRAKQVCKHFGWDEKAF